MWCLQYGFFFNGFRLYWSRVCFLWVSTSRKSLIKLSSIPPYTGTLAATLAFVRSIGIWALALHVLFPHEFSPWGEAGSTNYGKPWKRRVVLAAPSKSQRKSFTCLIWEHGQGKANSAKGPSTDCSHLIRSPVWPHLGHQVGLAMSSLCSPSLKCMCYIQHLKTNQFKIQDWWERANFPFFRLCVYVYLQ